MGNLWRLSDLAMQIDEFVSLICGTKFTEIGFFEFRVKMDTGHRLEHFALLLISIQSLIICISSGKSPLIRASAQCTHPIKVACSL